MVKIVHIYVAETSLGKKIIFWHFSSV